MPAPAPSFGTRLVQVLIVLILAAGAITAVLVVARAPLFDLDRFAIPKQLALTATALLAGLLWLARAERIELGIAELALLLTVAFGFGSLAFAENRWLALQSLGIVAAGAALFFSARSASTGGGRVALAAALVTAVLAGSVSGLAQAYGWSWSLLADTRAPGGSLGNRNFMAHLTVLGLPIAGWLASRVRNRLAFLVCTGALVVMSAAVVLSRSRAAWVGAGAATVAVIVAALLTRGPVPRVSRRRLAAVAGALGVGALAALTLPNQLDWRSRSPYRDSLRDVLNYREGSGRGRLIQYRNSLELAKRAPILGVGPGNWMVRYPEVTTPNDPSFDARDPIPTNPWPSSDWVALLAERGTLGTLAWLGFLASLAVIAIRRGRDPEHGAAAIAALGLLAAAAVQGLFDAVLLLAPPTLVTMAGLGALLPATRPVHTVELRGRRFRFLVGYLVVGGLLALRSASQLTAIAVASDGWPVREIETALRFDPGNHRLHLLAASRLRCPRSRPHAERAAALLPHHAAPRRALARCR